MTHISTNTSSNVDCLNISTWSSAADYLNILTGNGTGGFIIGTNTIGTNTYIINTGTFFDYSLYINIDCKFFKIKDKDIFIDNKNNTLIIFDTKNYFNQKIYKIKSLKLEVEVIDKNVYMLNKKNTKKNKTLLTEKYVGLKTNFTFSYINIASSTFNNINELTNISTGTGTGDYETCGYVNGTINSNFNINGINFFYKNLYCAISRENNNIFIDLKNNKAYIYDGINWIGNRIINLSFDIFENKKIKQIKNELKKRTLLTEKTISTTLKTTNKQCGIYTNINNTCGINTNINNTYGTLCTGYIN